MAENFAPYVVEGQVVPASAIATFQTPELNIPFDATGFQVHVLWTAAVNATLKIYKEILSVPPTGYVTGAMTMTGTYTLMDQATITFNQFLTRPFFFNAQKIKVTVEMTAAGTIDMRVDVTKPR